MQVRVGGTLSSPPPITTGVTKGSVLSPFLFNLVMAGLPSVIQQGLCHRVFCSVYVDDVALLVLASRRHIASARQALQRALDEVQCFQASRDLVLAATKSEALFVLPRGSRATSRIRTLRICGSDLPLEAISLDFGGTSKRHKPAAALNQPATAFLDAIKEPTLLFTDGSVLPATRKGAATLVAPQLKATRTRKLPFPGSSTAAELAGLHLVADLIATIPSGPACRPSTDAGHQIFLHLEPGHSGIEGNDLADTLAKSAHTDGSPIVRALHRDRRTAAYKPFRQLSDQLPRRGRALLLRLRIGCTWTPSRLYACGRGHTPACPSCGYTGTLGHLLLACPTHDSPRLRLESGYRALGLPPTMKHDLLFPAHSQLLAHRVLLSFLEETGLSILL
ncbi:uncharacterized protein LOC144121254 [Amblyomma americanum]